MKAPTIGQTFGSFGDDVAAQDGHADAPGAKRNAAASGEGERSGARSGPHRGPQWWIQGSVAALRRVERVHHEERGVEARERQREGASHMSERFSYFRCM